MSKEIDINNEEEILKECDFDYFYESENCSHELCMFYNDIQLQNADYFNCKQAHIDLGRIAITLNKQAQRIAELETKLAEKEKENNELMFIIEEIEQFSWEQLNNENFDKYKAYDEMLTKIRQLTRQSSYEEVHQDKISFAVEQLEKVKEWVINYSDLKGQNWDHTLNYLNNKIKQLREI